jgi:hypothetical protein
MGMFDVTPQEVELRVRRWLEEEKVEISPVSDSTSHFNLLVKTQSGLQFNVTQPTATPKAVLIGTRLEVPQEVSASLSKSRPQVRDDFVWDLRWLLVDVGLAFQIEPSEGLPKTIALTDRVFYDGLTQDRFAQAIQKVLTGTIAVIWHVQQYAPLPKVKKKRPELRKK